MKKDEIDDKLILDKEADDLVERKVRCSVYNEEKDTLGVRHNDNS